MIESNVVTILEEVGISLPEENGGKRDDGLNLYEQVKSTQTLLTHKNELDSVDLTTTKK